MWIFVPDSPTGLNLCSRQDVPRSLLLQGVMVHDRHVAALSCSNAFHGSHLPLCLPDPLAVLGIVAVSGLLFEAAFLVAEWRLQGRGLQWLWRGCDSLAPGHRLNSLWCAGLVAPPHAGSSPTRDQTRVSCIGRRILYP